MSGKQRQQLVGRVLLTWLALTAITVLPYAIAFMFEFPEWTEAYFTPLINVYWPAAVLAYAVAQSDFPVIQFGIFAMIENLLIAIAIVGIVRFLRWRLGAESKRAQQPDSPA